MLVGNQKAQALVAYQMEMGNVILRKIRIGKLICIYGVCKENG